MSAPRRLRRPALVEHRCPGACARMVPGHQFACDWCWQRLPREIRRSLVVHIRSGRSPGRDQVEAAAAQWFLDNPPVLPLPPPR